jgi:hypothetical protein
MSMLNRRSLILAAAGAAATAARPTAVLAAEAPAPPRGSRDTTRTGARAATPPTLRNTRGKILYIGDDENERGREWFSVTYRRDGQVTLRAYCEIDDGKVERDVVQSMTSKFAPLDCFVRLHVGGKFLGTGWIRVTDTDAECDVFNAQMGRLHQAVKLATPATSLVSHPLSTDALLLAAFDHSKPEKIQQWEGGLSTSPLLDGASGPLIGVGGRRSTEYVGAERIKVPAGTFDTHHYRLLMTPRADGTPRSEHIWCTHPDFVFVRGEVHGYLSNKTGFGYYELVEFES